MTIVIKGDRYYLPIQNGFKEISKAEAMRLYEDGDITHTETLEYD